MTNSVKQLELFPTPSNPDSATMEKEFEKLLESMGLTESKILNDQVKFSKSVGYSDFENAHYTGYMEMPILRTSKLIPKRVIPFSQAITLANKHKGKSSFDYWVVFYEDDEKFIRFVNTPANYLKTLKKFKGIISPDNSVHRDMPLGKQFTQIFLSRELALYLNQNGIEIIPNIRWGGPNTYPFCFDGIEHHSTVAVGTHGTVKNLLDRYFLFHGFKQMLNTLHPRNVILYGSLPKYMETLCHEQKIQVIHFKSQFAVARGESAWEQE
ncbi:MAG: DUF4417 domain-containing protein [Turicibacter sp.]|nr:DUF4417 domain-containing protein [Turicibacter sp.]